MEPMREKIAAALTVVLFLAICAMIMTGCSPREQPIARQAPAKQQPIDSSREVAKEVPPTHPTIPEEEFERRFAETFERASRPTVASTLTPEEQRRLDAHRQGRKEVLDAWKASVATDTTQPLRRAPVHVVHFAEVATPIMMLPNTRLQFRYPDWKGADGGPYTFAAYTMRFELLLSGQRTFVSERVVTGRLSAQCWTAVIRTEEFMTKQISTRLTLVPQGYTVGSASLTLPNFLGTNDPEGMSTSGVCK